MNKLYEENSIQDIADAIREKNGSSDTYTVAQMSGAIDDIETKVINYPSRIQFRNIYSGGGIPIDMSAIDTRYISDMSSMFSECKYISGLNDLNTGNATTMASMFNFAEYGEIDVSNWDLRKVTNMSGMFFGSKGKVYNMTIPEGVNVTRMFMQATITNDMGLNT